MGQNSQIQWTDATWNIARGCTKVDEDCKYCYMYRDSMGGKRHNPLEVVRTKTVFDMPLRYKETVSKAWSGRPLIFTCSLTDFFHESIDSYRHEAWDIIRQCPHLIFQILTKRPERLAACLPVDWGSGWDNVWLGASVGSQKGIERAYRLLDVPSKVYFLSLEPLHGEVKLNRAELLHENWRDIITIGRYIDWVIVGGESGFETGKYQYRPCDIEWIESIVDECRRAETPVFVKQMGTYLQKKMGLKAKHGGDINEFPKHLQIREFPKRK